MADLARAAYLVHLDQCGLTHAATPLHKIIAAIPLDHMARVRAEVTADLRTAGRHAPVRHMAHRPAAVIRRVVQATAHRVEVHLMVVDTPVIAHRLHPTLRRRAAALVAITEEAEAVLMVVAVAAVVRTVEVVAGATPAEDIAKQLYNHRGTQAVLRESLGIDESNPCATFLCPLW